MKWMTTYRSTMIGIIDYTDSIPETEQSESEELNNDSEVTDYVLEKFNVKNYVFHRGKVVET